MLHFFFAKHINVTFDFSLCNTLDMKYVCLLIYQIYIMKYDVIIDKGHSWGINCAFAGEITS